MTSTQPVDRRTEGLTVDQLLRSFDDSLGSPAGRSTAVPTGLDSLDTHLGGGLFAGDLCLLAGAQGIGKTSLALQMLRSVAAQGRPATYICFEHTAEQLLERLLVLEANLIAGDLAPTLEEVRHHLSRSTAGTLIGRLGDLPGIEAAVSNLAAYVSLLRIVEGRGDQTGLAVIRDCARKHVGDGVVAVDYLQKVQVDDSADNDRVSRIATALKDIALDTGQAVLAVSALDRDGLSAARVRARHLQGSVTLAYEADVILVVQQKWDVVARDRLVFDLAAAQDLHHWVVITIEKNRHGDDRVDLAFRKRLARGYFDPRGHIEEDLLVEERIHVDQL
jgi:replicative DNA helicase